VSKESLRNALRQLAARVGERALRKSAHKVQHFSAVSERDLPAAIERRANTIFAVDREA